MELRGQDKEMGMPSSFSYNNQLNREFSSSKVAAVSSSSGPINSIVGSERRKDRHQQTVLGVNNPNSSQSFQDHDHHPVYNHPEVNLAHHQRRDSEPEPERNPDPVSISATITTAIGNRSSSLRSSSQQQQQQHQKAVAEPEGLTSPTVAIDTSSSSVPLVRYRECLKNHAASMGSHVLDGCGEFMPKGEDGTPEGLKCAACECHRNFHRKEINGESQYAPSCYYSYNNNPNKNNSRRDSVIVHPHHHLQQPTPLHQQRFSHGGPSNMPVMMNFGGGGGGGSAGGGSGPVESSSEDLNMFHSNAGGASSQYPQSSKKRFRTKFSQDQKDKMLEFAEKLGWRIQKQDEQEVQEFCAQVGVKRQVFKVWMHNNKQAMKKKQM